MIFRICLALALIVFAILMGNGVEPETAVIRSAVVGFTCFILAYISMAVLSVVAQQSSESTGEEKVTEQISQEQNS